MSRKIVLLIIGIVFIAALIGLLLYSVLRKPTQTTTQPKNQPSSLESVKTPEKVFYPTLSLDEKSILYLPGQELSLHEFNLDTKKDATISHDYFAFVKNINWSPQKNKLLVWVLNNKTGLEATQSPFINKDLNDNVLLPYLFDLKSKKASPLSQNIQKITWTIDGSKIVYQYLDKTIKINNLNLSGPDGSNWKTIMDLKEENIFLNTLGTGEIVFSTSQTTDTFTTFKSDGSGIRTIKLPITVNINKIAWSKDAKSIFVAVREPNKTSDTFYKIEIKTGQKQEIKYQFQTPIDAKNLILTKDEKAIFLTSDDFLYKLVF